jgi:hypothetical protein
MKEARRQRLQERRHNDVMVVKACHLIHIKHPSKEALQETPRNRVASYSMSVIKASSGLMHLVKEMNEDVADIETAEVPEEFFSRTLLRHLVLATGETSRGNERVHALHEKHPFYSFYGTRCRGTGIFTPTGPCGT